MISNKKTLAALIHLACSGLVASGLAFAATAQAAEQEEEQAVELQKESVTGSHLKRVDIEGLTPVLVIDRDQIDNSGATTVAEVLRKLPSNSGPSFDEKFTNSFAPGSAGVSLRGLGQNATLILVNGRRVANYGFAQNINETFVDLNSIPLGAIERIEVLKDGASAIYGSDAIAGVINVILRKDYEGSEVELGYGGTDKGDGEETSANFLAGVNSAMGNITFNVNYFKRKAIMHTDRDFSKSANHESQGGYDFRSSAYPIANVRSASGPWLAINGFFDYNPYITLVPATERLSSMLNLNRDISENVRFFGEFSYTQVRTDAQMAPTPLFGDVEDVVVRADNPFNTYGEDVYTRWRMLDAGPRKSHIETDSYRILAGLEGTWGEWDWNGAAIYSRSKTVDNGKNFINRLALIDAIDKGEVNPFGTTRSDLDPVKASTNRTAISTLKSIDFTATTDIFELPAGSVGLALGAEYRKEAVEDTPDKLSEEGQIIGSGGTSSEGDRHLTSLYAEASVPIIDALEAQLAVRFEDYSDFGTTTNPKIGLRYQPNDWLMVRGSWGTGFRAPSLPEIYLGKSVSYPFLTDTRRCAVTGNDADCGGSQYKTEFSGNPDLDPEESDNIYLGLVVEPIDNLNIGLDYWKFKHTDRIDANTQYLLDHEEAFPGKVVRADPAFPGDPGEILLIKDTFLNLSEQKTDGIDLDVRYKIETDEYGTFELHGIGTYVFSFKRRAAPGEPLEDLVGTYGYPEFRGNLYLDWTRNDWGVYAALNYIGSYDQYYPEPDGSSGKVDAWTTFDLQVRYMGFESLDVRLGVDNLFDEEPPFSNSETEGYDFATHDPTGRFIYGRVKWEF